MNQSTKNIRKYMRQNMQRAFTLAFLLLCFAAGMKGQNQYVFMRNNTYYYVNGEGAWTGGSTGFNPSYIWTVTGNVPSNNDRYLVISSSGGWNPTYTASLSTSGNTDEHFTINDKYALRYEGWIYNYYLPYNLGNLSTGTSSADRVIAYQVTTSIGSSSSTPPTISGEDILQATGTYNYMTSVASYQAGGYTIYSFNDKKYYFDQDGNSFTSPSQATISSSYAWSLTANDYATVNAATGEITVSKLPTNDVTLTLTATATVVEETGKPAAPANVTLVGTKEIIIQGTVPVAPVISVSGTQVTMSTEAPGTTSIRYTLDGTDPTATTGTLYNGTFDISGSSTSPVTIKAVTVRNGNASSVTTEVVKLTLPEPVIIVDGTAGTATITCSNASATIYYTTDGSTPSATNGIKYTGAITGLNLMTNIKAIAVCDGWNDSSEATAMVEMPSGVSDGTVTLFDIEDHNWTYYSGVDTSVDGGNYNTNYAGKLYSPNPRNVKITYNGVNGISGSSTTVKVSIDEPETKFVYYKTLEEGTSDNYPYQVISNPFSVRPSTGSGGGKVYYGFAGWKIVSGHQYIKRADGTMAAEGATLSLDEEITFVGLPYPSVNCISAEIVFETTWKIANRTYISSNPDRDQTYGTDGDYESNFYVINCNYTRTITTSGPVTIMMVEPDGSDDYRDDYTFSGNITPNNTEVTKIEWAKWTTTGNINATGRNFTIGRGIQRPSGGGTLYGTNTNRNINQVFKIESGTYQNFYAIGSSGPGNNMTKQHIILGNDYDRANNGGDNSKLSITNNMYLFGKEVVVGTDKVKIIAKSGRFTPNLDHSTAQASGNCFYLWYNSGDGSGTRALEIEGGEFWHIAGGWDSGNDENSVNLKIRMKGGTIHGSVFGGAAKYDTKGYKQFIFTGGIVEGWIAGGSNGFDANGSNGQNGTVTGRSYVYVGGTTQVSSGNSVTSIDMSVGGNVYGAGCGNTTVNNSGRVTEQTNVVIADEAYVQRGVYGGGAYGSSSSMSNVYITGNAHIAGIYENTFDVYGGVYGGARAKGGGSVNIYLSGGLIEKGLYGGSNVTGTISGNVTMNINGGQVGTPGAPANIHGGGYGSATRVSQNVVITLGNEGQTTEGVQVYGDVYGGSALGYVNGTTASDTYHTYVTLNKGTINGSLYGGGLGEGTTAANVYGPVKVTVNGGSVKKTSEAGSGGVYGANNVYGAPQRSVTVDIYGTDPAPTADEYALHAVYGGGNLADYTYDSGPAVTVHNCGNSIEYVYGGGNAAAVAATNVTIWGGYVIGNVFGGGNGESGVPANVNGNASTTIHGGTILNVFGGSNRTGTIGGTITVNVEEQREVGHEACPVNITDLYGGGNRAASNAGNITIGCAEHIENVYGGANAADITGDINLLISSGHIGNVFGGNNNSGSINGSITVTVNDSEAACGMVVGNVYGAGNKAAYTGSPEVNIENGLIQNRVFGGGLGETATVTGTPQVNMTGGTVGYTETVDGKEVVRGGDVFGGGDAAPVVGDTQVVITGGEVKRNVYGGGNQASVSGKTNVQVGATPTP